MTWLFPLLKKVFYTKSLQPVLLNRVSQFKVHCLCTWGVDGFSTTILITHPLSNGKSLALGTPSLASSTRWGMLFYDESLTKHIPLSCYTLKINQMHGSCGVCWKSTSPNIAYSSLHGLGRDYIVCLPYFNFPLVSLLL